MDRRGQTAIIGAIVFGVVLIIALIVVVTGFDIVDPSHIGVKIRFGQVLGTMESGMQWTGMFTDVVPYDLRTRKEVIQLAGGNTAATKEGQVVYATINVNYRLKPDAIIAVHRKVGFDNEIADKLNLHPLITEAFKQTTVKYGWAEILAKREEVKEKSIGIIRENFPKEYFELEQIVITNIGFSPEFEKELEAKQLATQTALKEQNQLEAVKFQQQQNIEVAKAGAEKARLDYAAETEKLRLQKEQITPAILQKAWIDRWDGKLPTYVITTSDKANTLLNLPTLPEAK